MDSERIFISYSRNDAGFARRLAADLDRLGANVWIDVDDIPAGMKWSTAIQQGLDTCEVMIVVMSPDSMASQNVEDEWQAYLDDKKPVVPVLWRPTPKIHFQLRRIQYIDFHTQQYPVAFGLLYAELQRRNIRLAPLSTASSSILSTPPVPVLPSQAVKRGVPVVGRRGSQWWQAGLGVAVIVVILAILALSGVFGGGDDHNRTLSPADMAETLVAQRDATQTAAVMALTASNTPEASPSPEPTVTATLMPTDRPAPSSTPEPTSTLTVTPSPTVPTDTPEPTATFTPTDRPTFTPMTPIITSAPMFFPAGSSNRNWTPEEQDFDGVAMVYVPAGCFMMGSENGDPNEKPVREVCLDAYWIDKTEVTNGQFKTFNGLAANASHWTEDNRPRETITWFEAKAFCESRSARLPTEAEWEYAARGPEDWVYPWGNEWDGSKVVWNGSISAGTAPVGSKPDGVSWVGALDLSGNVWEWVNSIYQSYPYAADDGRESNNDTSSARVLRGGSWLGTDTDSFRASYRPWLQPVNSLFFGGVRCARSR